MLLLLAPWLAVAAEAPEPLVMDLSDALARVEADGPELAGARARADAARGVTRQALAAALPVIGASGSWVHNDHEVVLSFSNILENIPFPIDTSGFPDDVTIQPLEAWQGGAQARVPLIAPVAWADAASAGKRAQAANLQAEQVRVMVRGAVVRACAAADAAEGLVSVAEHSADLAVERRDAIERAVKAGTENKVALMSAEADVLARQSDLIEARSQLDGARDALGALIGVNGPVIVKMPDLTELPEGPARHLSVEVANYSLKAAEGQVQSAWWRHAPTLAATGQAATSTVNYPTGLSYAWKVGFELQWTLYDGGFRYGKLDQARADRESARAAVRAAELGADRAERDARRGLDVARERLVLAEARAEVAREAEQIALRGLEQGTVGALAAREAADRAADAGIAREVAEARLVTALVGVAESRGAAW
jgi:outer membrane protein TolC